MSDQWSPSSRDVPVLKLGDQGATLPSCFFYFWRLHGRSPIAR
ncbi:hypothetical protein HanXRQr2_Chr16g0757761 [Helianthus annuus]|uniref:Uncharacterized protein n=1 Tax=Helianthus annuus TaxID=4232 RepID=A0A9K3GYU2_HELAN|nr:hypothetical protein HanXRQr2_Chr16g0757761 [Helianthus annuus]KAJ0917071.1 hypothetical protein HanPSC8_Chr06g0269111 [Helianthus annuus]